MLKMSFCVQRSRAYVDAPSYCKTQEPSSSNQLSFCVGLSQTTIRLEQSRKRTKRFASFWNGSHLSVRLNRGFNSCIPRHLFFPISAMLPLDRFVSRQSPCLSRPTGYFFAGLTSALQRSPVQSHALTYLSHSSQILSLTGTRGGYFLSHQKQEREASQKSSPRTSITRICVQYTSSCQSYCVAYWQRVHKTGDPLPFPVSVHAALSMIEALDCRSSEVVTITAMSPIFQCPDCYYNMQVLNYSYIPYLAASAQLGVITQVDYQLKSSLLLITAKLCFIAI